MGGMNNRIAGLKDKISNPAHYIIYPVQPIQITRHLNFCLGNAVKYVLRAPYKGGVEDCDKASQYLFWENESEPLRLSIAAYTLVEKAINGLLDYFTNTDGDRLWNDISNCQTDFLLALDEYLCGNHSVENCISIVRDMAEILEMRDSSAAMYVGMSGFPESAHSMLLFRKDKSWE